MHTLCLCMFVNGNAEPDSAETLGMSSNQERKVDYSALCQALRYA